MPKTTAKTPAAKATVTATLMMPDGSEKTYAAKVGAPGAYKAVILAKDLEKALTEVRAARGKFPEDPDLATSEATVLRSKGDEAGYFVGSPP